MEGRLGHRVIMITIPTAQARSAKSCDPLVTSLRVRDPGTPVWEPVAPIGWDATMVGVSSGRIIVPVAGPHVAA
eukprot:1394175-Rhodomonas_salina.2